MIRLCQFCRAQNIRLNCYFKRIITIYIHFQHCAIWHHIELRSIASILNNLCWIWMTTKHGLNGFCKIGVAVVHPTRMAQFCRDTFFQASLFIFHLLTRLIFQLLNLMNVFDREHVVRKSCRNLSKMELYKNLMVVI